MVMSRTRSRDARCIPSVLPFPSFSTASNYRPHGSPVNATKHLTSHTQCTHTHPTFYPIVRGGYKFPAGQAIGSANPERKPKGREGRSVKTASEQTEISVSSMVRSSLICCKGPAWHARYLGTVLRDKRCDLPAQ